MFYVCFDRLMLIVSLTDLLKSHQGDIPLGISVREFLDYVSWGRKTTTNVSATATYAGAPGLGTCRKLRPTRPRELLSVVLILPSQWGATMDLSWGPSNRSCQRYWSCLANEGNYKMSADQNSWVLGEYLSLYPLLNKVCCSLSTWLPWGLCHWLGAFSLLSPREPLEPSHRRCY